MNKKNTILQTFFEINGKLEKLSSNVNAAKNAFASSDNRKYENLLTKAVLSSEKICLNIRNLASDTLKLMNNPLGFERINNAVSSEIHGIEIQKNDYFYEIKMPIVLPHYENKKSVLTAPLNNSLRIFNKETRIEKFKSAVIFFENHISSSSKIIRDNDNYEYKQVINSVAFWFLPDDSFDCCSMFTTTKIDEDSFTKIYIIPTEKFAEFYKNHTN